MELPEIRNFTTMNIALTAATHREIEQIQQYLAERLYLRGHHRFSIHITGVGMLNTAVGLMRAWSNEKPDIALQIGIAGSFQTLFSPPKVVTVREDQVGDLGVMESERWQDVFDMTLSDPDMFPFKNRVLPNPHFSLLQKTSLESVAAISINQITSSTQQARMLSAKYHPVVESMEGAAFHHVCLSEGIPFIQMRAISNYVGDRNKTNWKIQESISNLTNAAISFINKIAEPGHP